MALVMDIIQNYCQNIYNIYMIYIFRKSDCYNVSGPRLWAQPINLPFQLFPNDSEKDSSKTTCLGQQSKQTTKPVLSLTKLFPTALLLPFCQPGTLLPTKTKTKRTEMILDLSNMFGRASLENKWILFALYTFEKSRNKYLLTVCDFLLLLFFHKIGALTKHCVLVKEINWKKKKTFSFGYCPNYLT